MYKQQLPVWCYDATRHFFLSVSLWREGVKEAGGSEAGDRCAKVFTVLQYFDVENGWFYVSEQTGV